MQNAMQEIDKNGDLENNFIANNFNLNIETYGAIVFKMIVECFRLSKQQEKRNCGGNYKSEKCSRSCSCYTTRKHICIGAIENTKCETCTIDLLNLSHICAYAKRKKFIVRRGFVVGKNR